MIAHHALSFYFAGAVLSGIDVVLYGIITCVPRLFLFLSKKRNIPKAIKHFSSGQFSYSDRSLHYLSSLWFNISKQASVRTCLNDIRSEAAGCGIFGFSPHGIS